MDEYKKYIKHFSELQEFSESPEHFYRIADANFSKDAGFQRIGVHHITLPAGYRTSSPHAESLEEEFVFVIKGCPHLWLNGYLYELKPGHAIGFPAGTGVSHTFINNSSSEVELLVAGERTKPENLCAFPINPELKETCDIWWADVPKHELGPHNGLPGQVGKSYLGQDKPSCLAYCPDIELGKPFHYPGDNETFGEGIRLTDKVGLKVLGIWYEHLPPGRRSSWPHAHTHEEEFAFVLDGSPTAWLNGETFEMKAGEAVSFLPGTGVSHCIINDTDKPVTYLCVGETAEFPDEKITYPLHPLRNKECDRKGWFWKTAKADSLGPHNGRPRSSFDENIHLRLCTESDAEEVLKILESSPSYFQKVDGCLPSIKTARHAIVDGPKNTKESYFKEFLIIEHNYELIGIVDLCCNHPDEKVTYLGLLLIRESLFGRGLGRKCYSLIEDYVRRSFESRKIKIGVSDENNVSGFWEKVGFKPNGKSYKWEGEKKETNVKEYEKVISEGEKPL